MAFVSRSFMCMFQSVAWHPYTLASSYFCGRLVTIIDWYLSLWPFVFCTLLFCVGDMFCVSACVESGNVGIINYVFFFSVLQMLDSKRFARPNHEKNECTKTYGTLHFRRQYYSRRFCLNTVCAFYKNVLSNSDAPVIVRFFSLNCLPHSKVAHQVL